MKIIVTGLRGFPNIQGGVETHCQELYPRLAQKGLNITVVRRSGFVAENPPLKEYKGVSFKDINAPKVPGFEAALHTLRSVLYAKKMKADVLHIHAIGPSIVLPVAKLLGLKVVVTHHGPDYDRQKWGAFAKSILRCGERFVARYANDIIVISTVISDILKKKYNRTERVHLIYNGVNIPQRLSTTTYLQSLGIQPSNYILGVGRFVEEKNFDQLMDAFAGIRNTYPCQLVIAGGADYESAYADKLKAKAKEKGVILTGIIKGDKLVELFSHAALFVLPSSHEGLPITLLEAMSYNRKVIASNIPANLAVNLNPGFYFQLNDLSDLKEKMLRQLHREEQEQSYDLSRYDWNNIADQTLEVYQHLYSI